VVRIQTTGSFETQKRKKSPEERMDEVAGASSIYEKKGEEEQREGRELGERRSIIFIKRGMGGRKTLHQKISRRPTNPQTHPTNENLGRGKRSKKGASFGNHEVRATEMRRHLSEKKHS